MHRHPSLLGRAATILVLSSAALMAQGTQTCSITGEVQENGGAPIGEATIRLTSPSLQGVRTLATDAKGRFAARLLPPGAYTIEIFKSGYQTIRTSEKLGIEQNYQPRFTLVKTAGVVVEVVASATAVDKTDVKTSTNYSLDAVDNLPVVNRTQETVALLTPGVVSGVGNRVQIRGAMTSGNLYLVDGQNVADNAYGNRGSRLIDDSIEETQVQTGAISAEYGNVDGGVINSITRSGGNTFSGMIRDELSNPQWNAMQPMQNRSAIANQLSEQKTISLGGFIIPDRLWFYTSYFRTSVNTSTALTSVAALGTPTNYNYNKEEIRRQMKLTWMINQEHSLVYSWMNSQNGENARDYSAGELAALIPQSYKDSIYSVSLRSVWSPRVTSDLRFGQKKQAYYAGPSVDGTDPSNSPISDDASGDYYGHGIFNSNDGGDHRDNHTANAKVSLFWDAAGSHQTDMGYDYYEGIRRSRNEQTATGYILEVDNLKYATDGTKLGDAAALWTYQSGTGQATTTTHGIYVNDKWSLDEKLSVQIGLRYDKYSAKSDTGVSTVSANGFSPRVGLKYDLFADAKWIFGASWARYNSGVAEGITTKVTRQGNPMEIDYNYTGPASTRADGQFALVPGSPLFNPANYAQTAGNIAYYGNPTLNVKLADGLKAPHVDETQLSGAYSFKSDTIGDGYIRLTFVHKEWHDLLDYIQGNQGTVTDPAAKFTAYMKVWGNSSEAKRKYQDLELDGLTHLGQFDFGGNITWASERGNYEGEGSSTPSRGEGLQAWTTTNIASSVATATKGQARTVTFPSSVTAPYGALTGDTPLRIRMTASYVRNGDWGKTTYGFIYRFDSGSHYSDTRTIKPSQIDVDLASVGAGSTLTQYRDGQRGQYIYPASAYLDFALSQDWKLATVARTPVMAFVKLVFTNVFNHQQLISWNSTSLSATGTAPNAATPSAVSAVDSTWNRGASYGKATGSTNYGAARQIVASAGIRF